MQAGGAKNPPWARSSVNANMTGMNNQMMEANSMLPQQGIMPFQQQQVFNKNFMQSQGGMGMAMANQMPMGQGQMYPGNVVAYPTPRAMNPGMYQNQNSNANQPPGEQRVFTGTVTQAHNDIGFVDNDVFYQTSVCAKGIIPKVNDRVLVEATYNPSMPFKWNATRVQVLPKGGNNNMKPNQPHSNKNSYNAAPPPMSNNKKSMPSRRDDRSMPRRDDRVIKPPMQKRSRSRSTSRSRDRQNSRNRRDSPPRKRPAVHQPSPPKYSVRVPRMPLDVSRLDVPSLSQRYTNLYVPSDFFTAQVKWGETFPPQTPFSLNNPCTFHIMPKDVPNPVENDAVLEPPDADYRYSAKVMLIAMPTLESLYQKCGLTKAEKEDKDKRSSSKSSPQHPTRLIKFLVGQKGKGGENFAIGGPWSPSLDGDNPDKDPGVLIKTAIRTCKALTGIDLSTCSQWYRMVEFYYWREASGGRGRLERVAVFLPGPEPPAAAGWPAALERYAAAARRALDQLEAPQAPAPVSAPKDATIELDPPGDTTMNETITIDENDDEADKPEPTHFSKIDLKTIKVTQLRDELRARDAPAKGNRSQLVSRLSKLIKAEEAKEKGQEASDTEEKKDEPVIVETVEIKDDKEDEKKDAGDKPADKKLTEKELEDLKKKIEKEKAHIKSAYELPTSPAIIVHPNTAAKGGKFHCAVATLSLLLDYRISDNKEHSFELFVFAELFNEMLMRDFGFYIYKTLYTLPEKPEEVKEIKDKPVEKEGEAKDEKKEDKKDEKREDKKDEKREEKKDERKDDKKDDRRDDKRDSRRRDRKEGSSDDERSSSPRRRSRGVELPPDPYLLLALVYFDTARGGSINRKDLQNLFMSLGLHLSRSQLKGILDKVCQRDSFNYKSLVQSLKDVCSGAVDVMQDLPLDSNTADVPSHITELEQIIATGNRGLLPQSDRTQAGTEPGETKEVGDGSIVMYKSRAIDVGALIAAEARLTSQRLTLSNALDVARRQLIAAKSSANAAVAAEKTAKNDLAVKNTALNAAKGRVAALTASCKIFHSALKSVQTKVEAVVNIKYDEEEQAEQSDVANGPAKVEKKDVKNEDSKDEAAKQPADATKEDKPKQEEPKENTESKEQDNNATENMDLDDK